MTTYMAEARAQNLIGRYPVVAFFLIAYAFSWAIGGLLIANRHELLDVPQAFHYLSAFGPALAAVIVTALADGRAGLIDLGRRVVRFDVGWRWRLIGVGTPLALGLAAIIAYALSSSSLPDLALFGQVDYLGNIGVVAALALWIATYGFGEETGWRGFAFHHLQSIGWLRAAALIGLLWGLWHLPYFFYKENFMALGIGGFIGYLISIMMGSILLAWIYRGSGHSILIVALWHGLFDFVSASPIAEGTGNALISGAVILWVIIILRTAAKLKPSA